jgi:membrane protease YdiL (CAAX protease family)
MTDSTNKGRSPLLFVLLFFLLSIPFYLFGNQPLLPKSFHLYAPAFVFASIIPVSLANLFLYRERGWDGVKDLWRNVFDYKRIRNKFWYIPIFLLMPATLAATYVLMPLIGRSIPDPYLPVLVAPLLFAVFFILAIGEEAGWSGYVIGGLQERWSALTSSLVLGIVWAAWHVIPFLQAHHASNWWVVWQCAATVTLRILMVWIFNNTGKSVFAMVLFHAMINESELMFPNLGSYYDPLLPFVILTAVAAIVVFFWGGKTLARYRFSPSPAAAFDGP